MPAPATPTLRALNFREQRFVDALVADPSCTQTDAAIRAGYSVKTAKQTGSELMARPHIKAAVTAARSGMADKAQLDGAAVLARWWAVANADVNAVVSHRRTACRFCHGEDFRYQRTPNEMRRDRAKWEDQPVRGRAPFDEEGGIGYDRRKPPHPECPECFGEGTAEVFIADTRRLSGEASLLYAGIKETKDGVEVKLRDPEAALRDIARHLGMFEPKQASPETEDARAARIRADLDAMDAVTAGA